jgi:hypothetical protein
VAIPADRTVQKEAEKKLKYKFMFSDTVNVGHEMYDYTDNSRSHRNNNKRFKETFGSHTRKTFDRFTTGDSYTWNITHNTGGIAVRNLNLER